MKQLRKTISFFLVIALLFGQMPIPSGGITEVFAAGTSGIVASGTSGNITWKITEDTGVNWDLAQGTPYKLTLTGSGEMEDYNTSPVPWKDYKETITSISIANGITTIGIFAFDGCRCLQSVKFGTGLKTIKERAFSDNLSLTTLSLNKGLKEIGDNAFAGCRFESISLPDSLTTIGKYSFCGTSITSLIIPKNVTAIGASFLYNCNNLSEIQVAAGNSHFKVLDHVLYELKNGIPYRAIAFPAAAGDEIDVKVANGTEIIDSKAFYGYNITSVTLPDTLKCIKEDAFYNVGIKEINIPDSVEIIEHSGFYDCRFLEKIVIGSGLQQMDGSTFFSFNKLSIGQIIISDENPYLDAIDNVVYNKEHTLLCFYAPAKPDAVYHIPDTVKSISYGAIFHTALRELYMPESLSNFLSSAIWYNYKLKSIYFAGNAPAISWSSIRNNADNLILYKTASATGWEDDRVWSNYVFAVWDPEDTRLEEGNFGDAHWTYEGSIRRIKLTGSGEIPDFTEEESAPWLDYVDIIQTIEAEGVTGIGNNAFSNAENLLRVETDAKLKQIGEYAFADCKKLLFLDIAAVDSVGTAAFQNDVSIYSLILEKVSSIDVGAFKGCTSITDASIGACIVTLEEEVFADCTALKSFIVPESVSVIKTGALRNCASLRTINVPAHVNTIGSQAFANDTSLEKVYFYGGIPTNWSDDSFSNANGNLTLYYRKGQTGWTALNGSWHNLSIVRQERFYTERQDYYSFSNSASSFEYSSSYRVPRQRYVDVLESITTGTYYYAVNQGWSGSCFGMASSTLEFYENPDEFSVANYDTSAANLYQVTAPKNADSALTKLIEAYQISQYKSSVANTIFRNMDCYRDLILRVEEFERSGGLRIDSEADPIVMCIYSRYGGHAVIPVSVDQAENGDFLLQVYDPNYPNAFHTLKIYKDLSGIVYFGDIGVIYDSASYTNYSSIAAAMSGIELHSNETDRSLYLSIDKENGTVTNKDGDGIDKIEGAYEQKPLNGDEEDSFSGIKSFVLPEGDYQLSVESTEETGEAEVTGEAGVTGVTEETGVTGEKEEETVTFYLASEENYAEITSSDEEAILEVNETDVENGELEINIHSESTEEETTSFTVMNQQGMERTIEVVGSSATVVISENDTITVQASEKDTVSIDGKEAAVEAGQVVSSFEASAGEPSLKMKEFDTNVVCDEKNRLEGTASATVISNTSSTKNIVVAADFFDKEGNKLASRSEEKQLNAGLNSVTLSFEALETAFKETEGETSISCQLAITDENGKTVSSTVEEITVTLTKQQSTIVPDPDDSDKPNKPDKPDDSDTTDKTDDSNTTNQNTDTTSKVPETDGPATSQTDIAVTNVTVSTKKLTLGVGETFQLKASVLPENASDKTLTYKASNSKVSVTGKGKITAKKAGTSKITVKAANGKNTVVTVVVKKAPTKLSLNAKTKTLKVGKSFQISTKLPKNTASNKITYSSSKKSVATVSSTGKVTAKKKGTTTITVKTFNGKKAKMTIIVGGTPVTKVKVPKKKVVLGVGKSFQLKASVTPKKASDKTLTYKASNNRIKVTSKGKITAKKTGTSKVTVKASNGKKAVVTVVVKKK